MSRPLWAAFTTGDRGTATAQFLQLGVDARAIALGEAYSAVADDASALYWNPAGLARLPRGGGSLSLMHAPYVDSSYFDYAAAAQRVGPGTAVGAGMQYLNAGSIPETDPAGNAIGSFTPYETAATVGFAQGGRAGSLGVAGKWIQSKILDTAQTVAADVGYLTPALGGGRFRLAVVAQNLGGRMRFESEEEDLPLALRFGSAFHLTDHWDFSADLAFPRNNGPDLGVGTEARVPFAAGDFFAGRLGYNSRTAGALPGFTGLAVGAGFSFSRVALDYAFLPMGDLGQTHRISLTLRWGPAAGGSPTALSAARDASRKEAKTEGARCKELYGAVNCEEPPRSNLDRMNGPDNADPSARPW